MVLVPSIMSLLGKHAWWMPRWLEPVVPRLHLEDSLPAPAAASVPSAAAADAEPAAAARYRADQAEQDAPAERRTGSTRDIDR
jgi:uncharacterized membrane protein YdfJ with MMPL/SSD domain